MKIHRSQDKTDAASQCARAITQKILESVPHVLLLSGGSALEVIPFFESLWKEQNIPLRMLTLGMADERFDATYNNFLTLKASYPSFCSFVESNHGVFLDTSPRFPTQYEEADWYDQELTRVFVETEHQLGNITILLGLGDDGHTAGIVPYPPEEEQSFYPLFLDTDRLAVGYDATGKNQFPKRFTLTYPGLTRANELFVFACGEKKKEVLKTIETNTEPLHRYPGLFFANTSQTVTLFTDIQDN